MKVVSFKAPLEIIAIFPELSRQHGYKSIGDVIRRLLRQEAERIGLSADNIPTPKAHRRART